MKETAIALRFAARQQGEKTFNTGKPCIRGHVSPRYVSNGGCVECVNPKVLHEFNALQTVPPLSGYPIPDGVEITQELVNRLHGKVLGVIPSLLAEIEAEDKWLAAEKSVEDNTDKWENGSLGCSLEHAVAVEETWDA